MREKGNLPNLIIIGAAKCGTTSLHYYLNLHPQIHMSRQKELKFFSDEQNWNRGIQWYQSHFTGQAKIYGESTPQYTCFPICKGVPQRIFSVIPEAKLIYIIRDPIERIISQYIHLYADGQEHRSIQVALAELDGNPYVVRSKYFLQLQQYLKFFPNSNMLIISLEELSNYPQRTMKKVFQFLGVDANFEFEFNIKHITEFLKFGPEIINSNFKYDAKIHQSFDKRRKKISANNVIITALSKATATMPAEIKYHIEKIIYRPFSRKIERPVIEGHLRERLLAHLSEDMRRLQAYRESFL